MALPPSGTDPYEPAQHPSTPADANQRPGHPAADPDDASRPKTGQTAAGSGSGSGRHDYSRATADPSGIDAPGASAQAGSDTGPGLARQAAVYRAGALGRRPVVPASFAGLEQRAHRAMSRAAWAYVAGGAGEGRTVRRNRAAFDRWQVVPRMAAGAVDRDLSVELLGRRHPSPVLLAPIGAADLVTAGADLAVARAAAATRTAYIISNQGCAPMERTAAALGDNPRLFQLYWSKDERLVDSLIARAEAIGADALVVTLDTTVLGWRPADLTLGSLPFAQGIGIAQYTSDPRFRELVAARLAASARRRPGPGGRETAPEAPGQALGRKPATPSRGRNSQVTVGAIRTLLGMARRHPGPFWGNLRSPGPRAAVETFLDVYSNPGLSWDHLATLRSRTSLPFILKGILHPADAQRAFALGAAAVVVSNHGGRQVDNAVAALDALVTIREAVGPAPALWFDSGIRTGTDVFLALALGADAVLLGRPYLYGLAVGGQRGVEEVLGNVVAELDLTMALTGARDIASITRELLRTG